MRLSYRNVTDFLAPALEWIYEEQSPTSKTSVVPSHSIPVPTRTSFPEISNIAGSQQNKVVRSLTYSSHTTNYSKTYRHAVHYPYHTRDYELC